VVESTPSNKAGHLTLAAYKAFSKIKGINGNTKYKVKFFSLSFLRFLSNSTNKSRERERERPSQQRESSLHSYRRELHRSLRRTDPPFLSLLALAIFFCSLKINLVFVIFITRHPNNSFSPLALPLGRRQVGFVSIVNEITRRFILLF
jgi:hypothetical protein